MLKEFFVTALILPFFFFAAFIAAVDSLVFLAKTATATQSQRYPAPTMICVSMIMMI